MKEVDIDKLPMNNYKYIEEGTKYSELFWSGLVVVVFIGVLLFLLALIGIVAFFILDWLIIKTL